MRRVVHILLLMAGSAVAANSAFGQAASPEEIVTLELRLLPRDLRDGETLPAPRRLHAPRGAIKQLPEADSDGVFRRSAFMFAFPRVTGSAESVPRVDPVGVQFKLGSPRERDLAKLVPKASESPLPGLRAYENPEPQALGEMFAAEDPEFGAAYAICASIVPSRPPVCVIQTPLDSDLVILTTVKSSDLGNWRSSVQRDRERVSALLK